MLTATVSQILAAIQPRLTEANKINPGNPMKTSYDAGQVYIYKIPLNPPVIVYTTSAAIDCDGLARSECNTDPTNQGDTSCHDSNDNPLDPVAVPWYVIPESPNPFFDYTKYNISCAQVGLVIYGSNMHFGIFGDERGRDVGNSDGRMIGEISYGMAVPLGIDPDPDTGGIESGVTYIIFTGSNNVVSPPESTSAASTKGNSALNTMMSQLSGGGGGAGYNCVSGNCQYVTSNAQFTTLSACQAACTTGGGVPVCTPSCNTSTEICLAQIGINKCVNRQDLMLVGGAIFLLLLLK